MSRHRAHEGRRDNPTERAKGNTPCEACGALWAHFTETGDTDDHRFHGECLTSLCGPRLRPAETTFVHRKVPQLLPAGSKGWWER